jgi:5,10-methylenetetrahydromethanopterin reductase
VEVLVEYGMPWPGAEVAPDAEAGGISAFVAGEFADHEAYLTVAEMAHGSHTARVGTGIAYAFARTPFAHATALRQLSRMAPGRLFAGLGSAAYRINRDWFGVEADQPVKRMSELVEVLRAYLTAENGERIRYDGEFYRIDADIRAPVLGRLDLPILLGAFNPRMVTAAGRVGDGVIGHGLFTRLWWDEVIRPNLEKGGQEGERATPPLEYGWVITAVDDDDPDRAVLDARRMVGFYLTVRTYDPMVEMHGWQQPVERLRAAFKRGDNDAMAAAVTDEMLDAIAVCGTTEQAHAALAAKGSGLARDVVFLAAPSYLVGFRRRERYARSALALVGAAG